MLRSLVKYEFYLTKMHCFVQMSKKQRPDRPGSTARRTVCSGSFLNIKPTQFQSKYDVQMVQIEIESGSYQRKPDEIYVTSASMWSGGNCHVADEL